MDLPNDFQFSQGSLQDFVDCARRFQLRYVLRLQWPAEETEPALESERYLRQGAALHRLIRQHLVGLGVQWLEAGVTDPDLGRWWQNYLDARPGASASQRYPEVTLSTLIGEYRLSARYDLIAMWLDGRISIFDWKTYRRRPRREWLAERMQSRVYPYVLARAWRALDIERPMSAHDVSMIYWFAEFPERPEKFGYDAAKLSRDESYLSSLIGKIERRVGRCVEGELLPRTQEDELCRCCRYRSLCRRGVRAGRTTLGAETRASDDLSDFSLDVDQIAELELS